MAIKVLLADDHEIVREGLAALIENEKDMLLVGTAANGREAVRITKKVSPDVVVMDISMPELNGIDATRQIRGELPSVKVVMLSMHLNRRFVSEAIAAGAQGYLLKHCAYEELAAAVRSVVKGEVYLSPDAAKVVLSDYIRRVSDKKAAMTSDRGALTTREREVVQLAAEGKNSKEIARKLHLSPKTVEAHRRQAMDKLEIQSIAELTKYAIREGLTTL